MMYLGSKHCPRCGAPAAPRAEVVSTGRKCPRCRIEMQVVSLGETKVLECSTCLGLWLTTSAFESICSDKEKQSAALGSASLTGVDRTIAETKVNYVPCPECSQLMNRANFARCSGVIIDLCKQHGVWFDCNELSRIIEFIRAGGMEMSRAKEKTALEEERRRLQQEQHSAGPLSGFGDDHESDRTYGIASTSGLLRLLLG